VWDGGSQAEEETVQPVWPKAVGTEKKVYRGLGITSRGKWGGGGRAGERQNEPEQSGQLQEL